MVRSVLYPEDYVEGYSVGGYSLPDFSYAGYKKGNVSLPDLSTDNADINFSDYSPDRTGLYYVDTAWTNCLAAAKTLFDSLPEPRHIIIKIEKGLYKFDDRPEILNSYMCVIGTNVDECIFWIEKDSYRDVRMLDIGDSATSSYASIATGSAYTIASNVAQYSKDITVTDATGLSIGDEILIEGECTTEWIAFIGGEASNIWSAGDIEGLVFYRHITGISGNTITVDVSFPLAILTTFNPTLKVIDVAPIEESCIENISFCMEPLPLPNAASTADQDVVAETVEYRCAGSRMISFFNAKNCWLRNVKTSGINRNAKSYIKNTLWNVYPHIASNGITFDETARWITLKDCEVQSPQSYSSGGNGYLYSIQSPFVLIDSCVGKYGRHNFSFARAVATHCVIYNCTFEYGRNESDFHRHFSAANLIDSCTFNGDGIGARDRSTEDNGGSTSLDHGITTKASWFWNNHCIKPDGGTYFIWTQQPDNGGIIGTTGQHLYRTGNDDFLELIGRGAELEPQSLYVDQLAKRLGV